ncbi:hypothetical protein LXL04_002434 [Taraxacum kok-saghyz]
MVLRETDLIGEEDSLVGVIKLGSNPRLAGESDIVAKNNGLEEHLLVVFILNQHSSDLLKVLRDVEIAFVSVDIDVEIKCLVSCIRLHHLLLSIRCTKFNSRGFDRRDKDLDLAQEPPATGSAPVDRRVFSPLDFRLWIFRHPSSKSVQPKSSRKPSPPAAQLAKPKTKIRNLPPENRAHQVLDEMPARHHPSSTRHTPIIRGSRPKFPRITRAHKVLDVMPLGHHWALPGHHLGHPWSRPNFSDITDARQLCSANLGHHPDQRPTPDACHLFDEMPSRQRPDLLGHSRTNSITDSGPASGTVATSIRRRFDSFVKATNGFVPVKMAPLPGSNALELFPYQCMHTRRSGRTSPLKFDSEIERTARANRVNK